MELNINQAIQQAVAAHKEGKLEEAERLYRVVLQAQPTNVATHINLGNILMELRRLDEAEASYKKAIDLKPDSIEAYYNLSVTLQGLGRLDEAEASYKKAIEFKPDFIEAHSNLGVTLKELNKLDEAEASFKKAIELKPDYAESYCNLGVILQQLGKFDEAETSYRKAIELKPDFTEAHNNLGGILLDADRLEDAEASYKKAIELKPNFTEAHYNLGNILKILDRLEDAEASYKKAIELKPDYAEAYSKLGNILVIFGKLDEAEVRYKKAIELKPDYAEAKHLLAALAGETTNSPPREYVENLFDGYASKFERLMVDRLEYNSPKIITEMIVAKNPDVSLGSILDLGCGTGLIGVEIKKFCTNIKGIDLSNSMLEQARNKNIYNKLEHRDIVEYLSTEDLDFNYFISTDVFIYVGDLSDVFRLIKSRNKSRGKIAFSTEHTDKDGFVLEKSGRYSHSKKYIESLCEKFDYKLSYFKKTDLKKIRGKLIIGGLYLLDF